MIKSHFHFFWFFYRFLLRELTHALDLRIVCSTTKQGKQRWCCYFCQEKRERRAPFSENNLYSQLCVNSWSYQSPSINIWRTHFWYRKVVFWKRKRRKWNSHHYILFARLHSSWKMIEFSYLIKHFASPPTTWWCKAIDLLQRGGVVFNGIIKRLLSNSNGKNSAFVVQCCCSSNEEGYFRQWQWWKIIIILMMIVG